MGRLACTIIFSGPLDPRFDEAFDELTLSTSEGTSQLTGLLADQSQLQGVLRALFDLGLDLVSFTAEHATSGIGEESRVGHGRNHPGEPRSG